MQLWKTRQKGWNKTFVMSQEAHDGLKFFVDNCPKFENSFIRSAATEIYVLSIIGPPSSFMKSSLSLITCAWTTRRLGQVMRQDI